MSEHNDQCQCVECAARAATRCQRGAGADGLPDGLPAGADGLPDGRHEKRSAAVAAEVIAEVMEDPGAAAGSLATALTRADRLGIYSGRSEVCMEEWLSWSAVDRATAIGMLAGARAVTDPAGAWMQLGHLAALRPRR